MDRHMRAISYGGGVQSTAMIVLAAQGSIPTVDVALFANVGDDSEHPATPPYVRDVITPWAAARGIVVRELHRRRRDGTRETLLERLTTDTANGRVRDTIPWRGEDGGKPMGRACTADFKIQVVGKWLKANGATEQSKATTLIGISTDEITRVNKRKASPWEDPEYPLITLGLSRSDCLAVIRDAGLPEPHKSSCYFCPFHRPQVWAEMRRDEPDLFAQSVALEESVNARRKLLGREPLFLTRFGVPLADAVGEAQDMLPLFDVSPDMDECDEGYCFT